MDILEASLLLLIILKCGESVLKMMNLYRDAYEDRSDVNIFVSEKGEEKDE